MADDIAVTTCRNETRQLSLMSAIQVNSGTAGYGGDEWRVTETRQK